jgi:hypothetical protein
MLSRKRKIELLQGIARRRTTLEDVLAPVYGVIFIRDGKCVYARQDACGYTALEAEMDVETYLALHAGTYSQVVELVDFSQAK